MSSPLPQPLYSSSLPPAIPSFFYEPWRHRLESISVGVYASLNMSHHHPIRWIYFETFNNNHHALKISAMSMLFVLCQLLHNIPCSFLTEYIFLLSLFYVSSHIITTSPPRHHHIKSFNHPITNITSPHPVTKLLRHHCYTSSHYSLVRHLHIQVFYDRVASLHASRRWLIEI